MGIGCRVALSLGVLPLNSCFDIAVDSGNCFLVVFDLYLVLVGGRLYRSWMFLELLCF